MHIAPADPRLADLDPDIPGVLQLRNGSVFKGNVFDCPCDETHRHGMLLERGDGYYGRQQEREDSLNLFNQREYFPRMNKRKERKKTEEHNLQTARYPTMHEPVDRRQMAERKAFGSRAPSMITLHADMNQTSRSEERT
ncbi:hypothetical protein T310_5733 [Rasamsonia emersonii CBS 393.64]|uniref:Uncharacterized protein n=1 Tax=Rasamsonia emersonii (strain ATCC 16479 / CBS 393.64 / IMI 116815) TaxID=1408163 RepID=A0A0F4YQA6_RASE3|nr:hypothetical protein T310_5733 [Rasamsonia emersonii CBS 393.64]KKA20270.1 hypothetical protein T310_5733 [Rasamsonia emersonii CBS 393.64]